MSRVLFFIIIAVAGLLYLFNIDRFLAQRTTLLINGVKESYIQNVVSLQNFFEKYFQNVMLFQEIKDENSELKKYKTLYLQTSKELEDIIKNSTTLKEYKSYLDKVTVLSYVDFNDYTKVWLDKEKFDKNIHALISEDYAAGIVVNRQNRAQALLNGNEKSNYSVFIGDSNAPGITHSSLKKNLITIKFIPIWLEIKVGDEVITSGMDNIFFEGLKVGKVVDVIKKEDMQEALVSPYANTINQRVYYIYKREDVNSSKVIKDSNNSTKEQTLPPKKGNI